MANPLVPQGVLNKLRGAVAIIDNPDLNVTQSYLGDDGITLAFEGDMSAYIPTMTGAVPSANPFQIVTCTMHMLRTQGLSALWKAQAEDDTNIGDVSITTDSITLDDYYLSNCTIKMAPADLPIAGKTPEFVVVLQGIYYINSSLFDAAGT